MKRYLVGASAFFLLAGFVACSATDGTSTSSSSGNSGNSSGNASGGASSGTASGGASQNGTGVGGAGGFFTTDTSSGTGGTESCTGTNASAQLKPLDLFIMLDKSGSMQSDAGNTTRWDAVSGALSSFINDPESTGLGVGLQFFPQRKAGVPDSCNAPNQCGAGAPCLLGYCEQETANNNNIIVPCETNADCANNDCGNLGQCAFSGGFCAVAAGDCVFGSIDPCVPMSELGSECTEQDSCDVNDYIPPSVDIATLPSNAAALDSAINAEVPDGYSTPTEGGLQAAIDYASSWASANPTHEVVVVFATDGQPTNCDLSSGVISGVAGAGFNGDPSISTFVIGIVADSASQSLMNAIATAGGTGMPFLIDPGNQNLGQQFRDALEAIRGEALACEYLIPDPPEGETIDFSKINVKYTPDGSPDDITIPYVVNAGNCDPVSGGWYYDVDPMDGDPTTILICPATCEQFGMGGEVDIQVGCETIIDVPQ